MDRPALATEMPTGGARMNEREKLLDEVFEAAVVNDMNYFG